MALTENSETAKKDLCVFCWQETEYSIDTHINFRIGYIEGSGQLCKKCFKKERARKKEGVRE